jgi:hypothetical protein
MDEDSKSSKNEIETNGAGLGIRTANDVLAQRSEETGPTGRRGLVEEPDAVG